MVNLQTRGLFFCVVNPAGSSGTWAVVNLIWYVGYSSLERDDSNCRSRSFEKLRRTANQEAGTGSEATEG
jgi:hypothetical protein